jgi:hypothetical protein
LALARSSSLPALTSTRKTISAAAALCIRFRNLQKTGLRHLVQRCNARLFGKVHAAHCMLCHFPWRSFRDLLIPHRIQLCCQRDRVQRT